MAGAAPNTSLQIQPLDELHVPDGIDDNVGAAIDRALAERPELAQRVAQQRAAQAAIHGARSAYLPSLAINGVGGAMRAYGQQDMQAGVYGGPKEIWNACLSVQWTLFDGGRREAKAAEAHANERQAVAAMESDRNMIEEQVWVAWSNLQTAFRQRQAANALLTASKASYDASLKSYTYGLRNTVDVVSAQRTLRVQGETEEGSPCRSCGRRSGPRQAGANERD